MALVDEIVDLAVDGSSPISTLLRKCLVLAHTLKNQRLRAWVEKELDGYGKDDELPDYRDITASAKGDFIGPFGAYQKGRPLPPLILKEQHRHFATKIGMRGPIAAYTIDFDRPCVEWPAHLGLVSR
jgi:hypothetical protein